jgi:membrane associated rhomboid family serine protease
MVELGEWARAVTALTLHADSVHLLSNLVAGLGFGFCVARYFGSAWGWGLILLSGALGNSLNAWVYFPEPHLSVGASTAVFGALGLLTGAGSWHALLGPRLRWSVPRWFVPLFGGITLLGLTGLGRGMGVVDVAAHISGFLCGGLLGWMGAMIGPDRLCRAHLTIPVAGLSWFCLAAAWLLRWTTSGG